MWKCFTYVNDSHMWVIYICMSHTWHIIHYSSFAHLFKCEFDWHLTVHMPFTSFWKIHDESSDEIWPEKHCWPFINSLEWEKETHRNQNWRSNALGFFAKISQSMKDQRLKFDLLAIYGLVKRVYSFHLAIEPRTIQKFEEKKGDCLFNSRNAL